MAHMDFAVQKISKEHYLELCAQLWEHNRRYYIDNAPTISDYAYDQLLQELSEIEKRHPEWVFPGSPTQMVGEGIAGSFEVAPHEVPMLSLANTYTEGEVQDFIKRMHKMLQKADVPFAAEIKMDGIAVSLYYEEGIFVRGLTRGNGREGEEITQNLLTIPSLPVKLKNNFPKRLEVRGEVFMPVSAFKALNATRAQEGLNLFANPRNAAGGSLKLLDSALVAQRHLAIVMHGIAEVSDQPFSTHMEGLEFLHTLGLPVVTDKKLCHTFDEIWDFASKIEKKRGSFDFQIDGIVIKVNDLSSQKKLGVTGKNYRWAIAYKFSPEQVETKMHAITVQVGRTGVLTPVAELEPVLLAGSTIARATLHNVDEIRRKDIRIGDTVLIEKGGDVIPKVVGVNPHLRPKNAALWHMPKQCPACKCDVQQVEGEVAFRCPNKAHCPAQELGRLIHFASKAGMDIEHMGEKVVTQLVEKGFVKRLSDIYRLKKEQLFELKNFKEKAVENLIESIEKSKQVSLERFIMALGIKHVGIETATAIANATGDVEGLLQLTSEDLMKIEGIGAKVAESVLTFIADAENQGEIKRLLDHGVNPKKIEVKKYDNHPFFGKTFVLTGALMGYTRDHATSLIKERGGVTSNTVSKKTDYLLCGIDPGSKYEKALKLGVKVMVEEEFKAAVEAII